MERAFFLEMKRRIPQAQINDKTSQATHVDVDRKSKLHPQERKWP